MPHWRKFMDNSEYLVAADLMSDDGSSRDVTVTIARVDRGAMKQNGKMPAKKLPVVHFAGKEKPLGMNATNCKTVANLYGPLTQNWVGKRVTLYVTTTQSTDGVVDCIRIRPTVPPEKAQRPQPAQPQHDPSTGEVAPEEEPS